MITSISNSDEHLSLMTSSAISLSPPLVRVMIPIIVPPSLLRLSQITTLVLPASFYAVAAIFNSFSSPISNSNKYTNLWKAQLGITSLVLLITITDAFSVVKGSDPYSTADPEVVYHLFLCLVWTVLLLGLIDSWGSTKYPHYGAWALFFALSGIEMILHACSYPDCEMPLNLTLRIFQLALTSTLLGIGLLHHYTHKPEKDGTTDECQPLLDPPDSSIAKARDPIKDQEELDRQKIRERPFWQYLTSFRIFLPYMYPTSRQQQLFVGGMCMCSILGRLIAFALPLSLGRVIDALGGSTPPWDPIIVYGILKLVNSQAGIPMIDGWLSTRISSEMTTNLNRNSYNHIMKLSADFHDSSKKSITWSSMHYGQQVVSLFRDTIFDIVPTLVDLVAAASVLTYLFGPYMLFTILSTVILFYWLMFQTLKRKTELRRSWIDAYHDEYYQLTESSSNWTTVSHFGQISHEIGQYREKSSKTQAALMLWWFCDCSARAVRQLVPAVSLLAACGIAALQISHKQHKIGDFVVLITYWAQLTGPLGSLANEFLAIGQKLVQAEKLLVLLEKTPQTCDAQQAVPFHFMEGSVEFQNVTFSYDNQRKVTDNITFRASPGQTIALVGETGGGKSTILKLIYRFYDVSEGRILIDGQEIRKVQMDSFRKHIATVPQNPAVFNMTVMENVKYPDLDSSDEEAIEACKAAALHEKIMSFTNGYQEKVGERGTKLSGGELQRLAIARAILKKADIILLDEATSNVDSITETKIQEALRKLCANKTTFVIAHRLSTIMQADRILVIEQGKVNEVGTHKELIKRKGPYYGLWSSQLRLQAHKDASKLDPLSLVTDEAPLLINDMKITTDDAPILSKSTTTHESSSTYEEAKGDTGSDTSSLSS